MARLRLVIVVAIVGSVLCAVPSALAWKPFTHVYTADKAYTDVVSDGEVTIEGREYAVKPEVVAALSEPTRVLQRRRGRPRRLPGPHLRPVVVHPEQTGKWLKHILTQAWEAQTDPPTPRPRSSQILAFAYGYLTHAAGDMWAHTLVNDVAGGVFPAVGEILTDVDDAEIAIRHIIVEGYVGDATPGYDGNKERGPVPGEVNEDGDPEVSDDATPQIAFAAPQALHLRDLHQPGHAAARRHLRRRRSTTTTTASPTTAAPAARTRDDGRPERDGEPDGDGRAARPADRLLPRHAGRARRSPRRATPGTRSTRTARSSTRTATSAPRRSRCTPCAARRRPDRLQQLRGRRLLRRSTRVDLAADLTIDNLVETYLEHWIDDIEDGLKNWSDLGLARPRRSSTRARTATAQNHICRNEPDDENSLLRANCEDGVGPLDVLGYESEDFINDHLISMLGAPDLVGDLNELFGVISATRSTTCSGRR